MRRVCRSSPSSSLNVTGTVARLYLIRVVGDIFDKPIEAVIDFFHGYRIPLLSVTVAVVGLIVWNEHRHGKGEIESLTHLEQELEQIQAEEIRAEESEE